MNAGFPLDRPVHIITLDMDWAPDWMLEDCLRRLVDAEVAATWFVTHDTPVLEEIAKRNDLFEAGIHPNCLQGSSHGSTDEEVLSHICSLLPEARSMRTHGLYQSTSFLELAAAGGIERDVSLFLPWAARLEPHVLPISGNTMLRFPYFWEDDVAVETPGAPWDLDDPAFHGPGLKIFDFHPVHVALNTGSMAVYTELKRERPLQEWNREFVAEHANAGAGPGTLFRELCSNLSGKGITIEKLAGLVEGGS